MSKHKKSFQNKNLVSLGSEDQEDVEDVVEDEETSELKTRYFKNVRTNKKGEGVRTSLCSMSAAPGEVVCISVDHQKNKYRKGQLDALLKLQEETDVKWFEEVSEPKAEKEVSE